MLTLNARPSDLIRLAMPRLNKCDWIEEYLKQVDARDYDITWARVTETKVLGVAEWNDFMRGLLTDRDWLAGKGGCDSWAGIEMNGRTEWLQLTEPERDEWRKCSFILVVAVQCAGATIYVDPQGYNYARYVGFAADGMPEPKTREELRREEERAKAQAKIAAEAHALINPAPVPDNHGLRFFWNGIKTKSGKLEKVSYSKGALINHPDENIITIYGEHWRGFSDDIRACFLVQNDSDGYSDYYDNDKIRLTTVHPLYAEVLRAYEAQEAHHKAVQAKRNAKASHSIFREELGKALNQTVQ